VIDDLVKMRNEKIEEIARRNVPEQLGCFGNAPQKYRRMPMLARAEIPSRMTMRSPTVGDVEGIDVNMIMSHRKNAPLFIECNHATIAYLRAACKWQLENGSIKRKRNEKKHKIANALPAEDADGRISDEDDADPSTPTPSDIEPAPSLDEKDLQASIVCNADTMRPRNGKITSFFAPA